MSGGGNVVLFGLNPRDVGFDNVSRLSGGTIIEPQEVQRMLAGRYYSCMSRDYLQVLKILIRNRFHFEISVPDADQNINPPLRVGSLVVIPVFEGIKTGLDAEDMTAKELQKGRVKHFVVFQVLR